MVKYNESIIYKLCCNDLNITDIYIGSTTNFNRRRGQHKSCCNNDNDKNKQYNCSIYKFIRDNGNWGNWSMLQIESYEAKDKRDLEARERYWIETLNSSLNKNIPTQTRAEYYQNNKEVLAEKNAEYRKNNKEIIAEYRKNNKEIIAEYYQNNKEVIAEYYQNNKEVIAKKRVEYYQNNKEVLAVKVVCECGSTISKSYLTAHKKTKKHINFLKI